MDEKVKAGIEKVFCYNLEQDELTTREKVINVSGYLMCLLDMGHITPEEYHTAGSKLIDWGSKRI